MTSKSNESHLARNHLVFNSFPSLSCFSLISILIAVSEVICYFKFKHILIKLVVISFQLVFYKLKVKLNDSKNICLQNPKVCFSKELSHLKSVHM